MRPSGHGLDSTGLGGLFPLSSDSNILSRTECWSLRKEDERRLLVAEMSWLRKIIGRSRREKVRNEQTRKELGLKKQWYKRSRKGDYSGLDTWKGWRREDYQMQLYMDM